MPCLERINSTETGVTTLTQQYATIGRSPSCDVRLLHHHEISREHCGLRRYDDGVVTVTDLGSKNGTYVNNDRIYAETKLQQGDTIRLSKLVEFRFHVADTVTEPEALAAGEATMADETAAALQAPKAPAAPKPPLDLAKAADEVGKEMENHGFKTLMAKFSREARAKPHKPRPGGSDSKDGGSESGEQFW
jgi:pSer/pThr/pTyr-binding forkhead associated (FHA) protein